MVQYSNLDSKSQLNEEGLVMGCPHPVPGYESQLPSMLEEDCSGVLSRIDSDPVVGDDGGGRRWHLNIQEVISDAANADSANSKLSFRKLVNFFRHFDSHFCSKTLRITKLKYVNMK